MTAETTEPTTDARDEVRRRNYMTALSLAEQMMSEAAALPSSFDIAVHYFAPDSPEIRFYFHRDAAGLRQFRDDQWMVEREEHREDGSVYIEATRPEIRGVRVIAWTLLPADESAAVAA
ncbi:hypothetical protein [Streptomyces sp. NPDC003730]